MNQKTLGLFLCSTFLSFNLYAKDTFTTKDISMEQAQTMASLAIAHCKGLGYLVSATVVDNAGNVKAVLRMDGAGPHTLDASKRKAFTSASAKNKTSAMLLASQSNPLAQNLGEIEGFLLLGGGVPVQNASGMVIGAIGVGGAPNGNLDEECATAGINQSKN